MEAAFAASPDLRETLISAKLNIPGPVKRNETLEAVFARAEAAIAAALEAADIAIRRHEAWSFPTGPESLWMVAAEPLEVKRQMVAIEEGHPWGRLFDLDVEGRSGAVSREELGLPERRCFLCGRPARLCARARTHSVDEMVAWIEQLIEDEGGRDGLSPFWQDAGLPY